MHGWIVGSVIVVLYMPTVALVSCDDMTKCEARTFIAGSIGSLLPTLGFIPMLARFPAYIQEIETRGIDQPALVQLFKFQELNRVRLGCRLVFVVSFLLLGLDWARGVHPLTVHAFWTDMLGYLGSIGYTISLALTLTIHSPRPTVPQSTSFAHATEKWFPGQAIGLRAAGVGTWANQGPVLEIGRSRPVNEPTFTHRHVPSLPAMVEQVGWSTEHHSSIPVGNLPPLALEPNRRRVEPEEELEEPTSPLLATSQKLAKTIRSLPPKRGN